MLGRVTMHRQPCRPKRTSHIKAKVRSVFQVARLPEAKRQSGAFQIMQEGQADKVWKTGRWSGTTCCGGSSEGAVTDTKKPPNRHRYHHRLATSAAAARPGGPAALVDKNDSEALVIIIIIIIFIIIIKFCHWHAGKGSFSPGQRVPTSPA